MSVHPRFPIGPASVIAVMIVAAPVRAQADDELAAFQLAMNAYDTGEYETARVRFQALLERDPPLKNKALVLEIHKYLGATLMFLGQTEQAKAQFEELLREDPEYELDPVLFPTEVLDTFTKVKIGIADELAAIQAAKAQAAAEAKAEKEAKIAALKKKIEDSAKPVYVVRADQPRSLLLALIPFGVGQFQNGQDLKGWIFLGTEMTLLAANVTCFILTEHFKEKARDTYSTRYINTAEVYWTATQTLASLTVAAMVAGIIDAIVYYVRLGKVPPVWKKVDESEVPPDVRPPPPELPTEELDQLLGFTFTWRM